VIKRNLFILTIGGAVALFAGCTTIEGYARIEHFPTDEYCGFKTPIHFTSNDPEVRLDWVLYDFNWANNIDLDHINRTCLPMPILPPCNIPAAQCNGVVGSLESHPAGTHPFRFEEFTPGNTLWGGLRLRKPGGHAGDFPTGHDLDGTKLIMWFIKDGETRTVEATFSESAQPETWRAEFSARF
jgi:hypothetical protein